jgi:hypothetical protein
MKKKEKKKMRDGDDLLRAVQANLINTASLFTYHGVFFLRQCHRQSADCVAGVAVCNCRLF